MNDKAYLTITFDDGATSVYTGALPILSERGIVASCGVNSGTLNATRFMTTAQCLALKDAGWTIYNHTENHLHLTAQDDATIRSEYVNCKNWLESNGFSATKDYCVFPYNEYDKNVLDIVKSEGCVFAFGVSERDTGILVGDAFEMSRSSMSGVSTATMQSRIDSIVEKKLHLALYYHYVDEPASGSLSVTSADLEDQMDYIKTKVDAGLLEVMNLYDYANTFCFSNRLKINGIKQ